MRRYIVLLLALLPLVAGAEVWQARYGVAETFDFKLYNADGTLDVDEADGGTEVSVSCNEGAETTATNDFVDEGTFYSIALTATEMQCERVTVVIAATTTEVFFIQTSANASAMTPTYQVNVASHDAGAIEAADFAAGAIDATAIATDAIGAAELAADAIGASEVATDAIGAAELAANAIAASEVADGAIDAGAIADSAIDEATFVCTGGSFDALGIIDCGTAQAATGTTLQLRSAASFADDEVIGATCVITGGSAGVGQARAITDYVSSTDTATVATWTTTPTGTITYACFGTAAGSGSVSIASGGITAASFASGAIDAAAIAADAIGASEVAADAIGASELATDAVGAAEIAASAIGASELADGGITSAEFGSGAITATVLATDAIGAAEVAADVSTELLTGLAGLAVNTTQVSGDTAAADNVELAFDDTAGAVRWSQIIDQGTAQSATGTTLVLRAAAAFADDELVGSEILITGGTGIGQVRQITDYVSATDTATVATWTTTPSGTITYQVLPNITSAAGGLTAADVWAHATRTLSNGAIVAATFGAGAIDAAALAADAIGASEVATDAIGAAEIANAAIDAATFAAGAVDASAIATDAIGAAEIAADAIGASEVATDAVGAAELAASAIGAAEIATGAVDADALATDAVEEVWNIVIEDQGGGVAARCSLAVILAAVAGDVATTGTNSTFEESSGTETRLSSAQPTAGNRTVTITCPTY